MGRYRIGAIIWVSLVALVASMATIQSLLPWTVTGIDWLAFLVIALCAAVAHLFPIRSAASGATYQMTNVFIIAGAILLPPGLITPLTLAALTPDTWRRRHNHGFAVRWVFNLAQTALAAHVAHAWYASVAGWHSGDLAFLAALLGAAALFTLVQALLVGLVIAFNTGIPLRRVDTFALPALLGDGLLGLIGALVATLWMTRPVLPVLVLPVLYIAYRLTKTAHLARLAHVDVKTGLHNSQHFEHLVAQELAHSLRVNCPLAILFADMDHFKQINDTYGHAAGDQVLRDAAGLMLSTLRASDVVARFGGEEFVALLPGTDDEEAIHLGERIRRVIEEHCFVLADGTQLRCTISIGIAACPNDGHTVEMLMKQADMAMYRAKQGRNAVARARAVPSVPRLYDATAALPARPVKVSSPPLPATTVPSVLAQSLLWLSNSLSILIIAWSLYTISLAQRWPDLLPFLALAVIAERLNVYLDGSNRQARFISFSIAVMMAVVTLVPDGAPLAGLATGLTALTRAGSKPAGIAVFTATSPALAGIAATTVFRALSPAVGNFNDSHLIAALAAIASWYCIDAGLSAVRANVWTRRRGLDALREAAWFAPAAIILGLTGAFAGSLHAQLGTLGLVIFVLPVLMLRYALSIYRQASQRTITTLETTRTELEHAHREKEETLRSLIETIAAIIDARDNAVAGHSTRVARYAVALGEQLDLTPTELAFVHTAGLIHDLGKVAIAETILQKPSQLTDEEYEVIKRHPMIGQQILTGVKPLQQVARMIGDHHEQHDGGGYPTGKAGEAIILGGRILAVADTLDAILSDQPYAQARSLAWAIAEINRCSGTQFHPEVVAALNRVVEQYGPEFFMPGEAPALRERTEEPTALLTPYTMPGTKPAADQGAAYT